jgi:transposase-like protein
MDTDAPNPRCPYCSGGMQFKRPGFGERSARQNFECGGCRVTLTVPFGTEIFEMSAPASNG